MGSEHDEAEDAEITDSLDNEDRHGVRGFAFQEHGALPSVSADHFK